MGARLGYVLYWTFCLLAALWLAIGWVNYPGVDTTGIIKARVSGLSDAQIFKDRKSASPESYKYDEALKDGYTPTEILNYLVERDTSKYAGFPKTPEGWPVYLAALAAGVTWLIGRALRYILAGN
jgi:hypothetical protein